MRIGYLIAGVIILVGLGIGSAPDTDTIQMDDYREDSEYVTYEVECSGEDRLYIDEQLAKEEGVCESNWVFGGFVVLCGIAAAIGTRIGPEEGVG